MEIKEGKIELKNDVLLIPTALRNKGREVFMATPKGYTTYYLFVYKENNNYEIHNKGNCIGEQGIIKQWEIMKVLNG